MIRSALGLPPSPASSAPCVGGAAAGVAARRVVNFCGGGRPAGVREHRAARRPRRPTRAGVRPFETRFQLGWVDRRRDPPVLHRDRRAGRLPGRRACRRVPLAPARDVEPTRGRCLAGSRGSGSGATASPPRRERRRRRRSRRASQRPGASSSVGVGSGVGRRATARRARSRRRGRRRPDERLAARDLVVADADAEQPLDEHVVGRASRRAGGGPPRRCAARRRR